MRTQQLSFQIKDYAKKDWKAAIFDVAEANWQLFFMFYGPLTRGRWCCTSRQVHRLHVYKLSALSRVNMAGTAGHPCVVCHKTKDTHPHFLFHRFPKDSSER